MNKIDNLLSIMAALRHPETGCAWDIKQTFQTISPYTIEEAYEVADAVTRGDFKDLKEELGDLLLQVVFHSRMAEEQGEFTFNDVVTGISDKMARRHPHVFGEVKTRDIGEINALWEKIKLSEKPKRTGYFSSITNGLPPLIKAEKIQKKVAEVGFDWDKIDDVFDKVIEEIEELRVEIKSGSREKQTDELGDVFFALVNLARHLKISPEVAIAGTNDKFMQRFLAVETHLATQNIPLEKASLEEMETAWNAIKKLKPL